VVVVRRAGAVIVLGDESKPPGCTCEQRPTLSGDTVLVVWLWGCKLHAPELYLGYCVMKFEAGPQSIAFTINCGDGTSTVMVDGKAARLPHEQARRIYIAAREAFYDRQKARTTRRKSDG
jgi:hypothetical protein